MIRSLDDRHAFRARRERAWRNSADYWLRGPLRHVTDVGDYIVARTIELCRATNRERPQVVDMGIGDAWLLRALLHTGISFSYAGLDVTPLFLSRARAEFGQLPHVRFEHVDLETTVSLSFDADVVVNAFNFLELCDLDVAMENAARFLRPSGTLLASTIDKTYLLLALSHGWDGFIENLRLYQELPGIKYDFQPIDLGIAVSSDLEYPSVLYSADDFISGARRQNLALAGYREHAFTSKPVPKIYCHYEFVKDSSS